MSKVPSAKDVALELGRSAKWQPGEAEFEYAPLRASAKAIMDAAKEAADEPGVGPEYRCGWVEVEPLLAALSTILPEEDRRETK